MDSKPLIKISVRNLVEFVLRSGDLVSGTGAAGVGRMADGIRGHKAVQKAAGENYTKEVAVSYRVEGENLELEVSGRIDGVIKEENSITIDEIKTTMQPLEYIEKSYNPIHWAQAKCYAYIYSVRNELEIVNVRLTYYQLETSEIKFFIETFSFNQLKDFFNSVVNEYMDWAWTLHQWAVLRNASAKELKFPFNSFRKGQKELAAAVYRTICAEKKLFANAPTGIGKTMATIFPAVKAMGEGHTSKIFYLTAKTIARTVAENAFDGLSRQGLRIKFITLTAKDKICFNRGDSGCDPQNCEYAKGYFDRVKEAIKDIFSLDSFTREAIEEYAEKHKVCPFEFSLDLSLFSDVIICDYNYVFDPRVYLKRFFADKGGDYCFLIDEAHNLVDRARDMFSAELYKKKFLDLKRLTKKKFPKLSNISGRINDFFITLRKRCEEEDEVFLVMEQAPKELYTLLREFYTYVERLTSGGEKFEFEKEIIEVYFEVIGFMRTFEGYDERYVSYCERGGTDIKLKLFCLDPSYLLSDAMERGKASVLFSATLTPMNYFQRILGGDEASSKIRLESPFPTENMCLLMHDGISTRYKNRENSYDQIAQSIKYAVEGKMGNYLVYFPSYKYMEEVYLRFYSISSGVRTIYQRTGMSELEKEEFLEAFSGTCTDTLVGFAVMGGVFGEGIDLVGERLSGAVIVGVGLPQVCLEREIIKDYFNSMGGEGFEYAYIYPGMNKVLQAAGRVIRSETDRGIVLLIDERFSSARYRELYPAEWSNCRKVNKNNIKALVAKFWGI